MEIQEFKIEVYTPPEFVEKLRDALNGIGACRVGNYDKCVSVTQVSGFWRPLESAKPYDGMVGELSQGNECKMELRCRKEYVKEALRIIRFIHPYEEPVINIIPLMNHFFETGELQERNL